MADFYVAEQRVIRRNSVRIFTIGEFQRAKGEETTAKRLKTRLQPCYGSASGTFQLRIYARKRKQGAHWPPALGHFVFSRPISTRHSVQRLG